MSLLELLLVVQTAVPGDTVPPYLAFPEPGLDDPAAYEGYETRVYRDASGNAFQVYLNRSKGRVVHLWADALNESAGFTARDSAGAPAELAWSSGSAVVGASGRTRSVSYGLEAPSSITLGLLLLGSMRVERDFQYARRDSLPLDATPFPQPELSQLIDHIAKLPGAERARHLALLGVKTPGALRARLLPRITEQHGDTAWVVRVEQVSFDGKTHLWLALEGDARETVAAVRGGTITARRRRRPLRGPRDHGRPGPDAAVARRDLQRRFPPFLRDRPRRFGPSRSVPAARARSARHGAALLAGEVDGRAAELRDLLRPRHVDDGPADGAGVGAGDAGARHRERVAQALGRGRRKSRGGARRPSDPRACVRVQPAGGRRSGGAGPRGAPGPPGGARELRDGGRRLPAAGGRGPLFERPAGAGRAQAHVSAGGAPPPAARHQSRVRDAASSGVHPKSGGDQAGQLSPGSRRPLDLRELARLPGRVRR